MNAHLPPILIVDDEKNMRRSLQTMLGEEGYRVETSESAEDALNMLAREEFFLVITDARLGGMNGTNCLKKSTSSGRSFPP